MQLLEAGPDKKERIDLLAGQAELSMPAQKSGFTQACRCISVPTLLPGFFVVQRDFLLVLVNFGVLVWEARPARVRIGEERVKPTENVTASCPGPCELQDIFVSDPIPHTEQRFSADQQEPAAVHGPCRMEKIHGAFAASFSGFILAGAALPAPPAPQTPPGTPKSLLSAGAFPLTLTCSISPGEFPSHSILSFAIF